jgi:dihydrofolate reductase
MIISIMVAMDETRGIGVRGRLPWRLSSDLKRFKSLTMGHHIVMGRRTAESIGKALPGRQAIVVTRNPAYTAEGRLISGSVDEAIALANQRGESEVFICGGADVYSMALPIADRIYLTSVHAVVEADTFFPEWSRDQWRLLESSEHPPDDENQFPSTFEILIRNQD